MAQGSRPWSSGLFSCFDDCGSCCMTCWCPCITAGRIVEIVDQGQTTCVLGGIIWYLLASVGCSCVYSFGYRQKMRAKFGLPEEPCADILVHCCCEGCSLCQEYRELKQLGYDPALGWAHYATQGGQPGQPGQFVVGKPPVPQTMG